MNNKRKMKKKSFCQQVLGKTRKGSGTVFRPVTWENTIFSFPVILL
jgi:hypothetical protein